MTWRYVPARTIREVRRGSEVVWTDVTWDIREYFDESPGRGPSWSSEPVAPRSENRAGLRQELRNILADAAQASHFLDLDATPPRLRPMSEA